MTTIHGNSFATMIFKDMNAGSEIPDSRAQYNDDQEKEVEISARTGKPKRRKALRACTNCQRTHLTCDDNRPCERCVKRGYADTCVDGVRKLSRMSRAGRGGGKKPTSPDMVASPHQPTPMHAVNTDNGHNNSFDTLGSQDYAYQYRPLESMPSYRNPFTGTQINSEQGPSRYVFYPEGGLPNEELQSSRDRQKQEHNSYEHLYYPAYGVDHGNGKPELSPHYSSAINHYQDSHAYQSLYPEYNPNHILNTENHSGESIISSMLHKDERDSGQSALSQLEVSDEAHHPASARSAKIQQEADTYAQHHDGIPMHDSTYITEEWLDFPMNPFINAHDEPSRRHSGPYEESNQNLTVPDVIEPFDYLGAFRHGYAKLTKRLNPELMVQTRKYFMRLINIGLSIDRALTVEDHYFIEQCFYRSLIEEQRHFALEPAGCVTWRKSGNIAALSASFTRMTGWTLQDLKSEFITSIMDPKGALNYLRCLDMMVTSHNREFKFPCKIIGPQGKIVMADAEITMQRDLFGMPLSITGKFWERHP